MIPFFYVSEPRHNPNFYFDRGEVEGVEVVYTGTKAWLQYLLEGDEVVETVPRPSHGVTFLLYYSLEC